MAKTAAKKTKSKEVAVKETKATKKSKALAAAEQEVEAFNPYAHLGTEIDAMEKKFDLSSMAVSEDEDRISLGLLSIDVALAGGLLAGGWYTFFGGEQSCKTTLATTALGSIATNKEFLGIGGFFDFEGSFQADYAESIFRYMNKGKRIAVDNVFGIKGEGGEWTVQPRVRYYAPSVGEDFYNWLAKLGKTLPDLIKMDGKFYYVYDNTKANQKALKGKYDAGYFKKYNKFRIRAASGMPQAVVLVDSYPAMVPRQTDEKDEGDKSLGSQARMHAEGLKRVKGMMRSKRVVVLGINQLRDIPMAMYGPTEQEPGGKALRFFSDVRLKMTSVSVPHGKGPFEEEDGINGGEDKYRYIKCKVHKNKLGGPQATEISLRIRVEGEDGEATGFCRVWDCFNYLKGTGQFSGTRAKLKLNVKGFGDGEVKLTWIQFKTLIEGTADQIREVCAQLKLKKPIRLYELCRKQVDSGTGFKLFVEAKAASKKAKKVISSDEDDDE